MSPIDPSTCPTSADLSRADLRVLHRFCEGADVVEFGCGGSTLFLAQIAKTLISYDTSHDWLELVRRQFSDDKRPILLHCDAVPAVLPRADVYFVDGVEELRPEWVRRCMDERRAHTIIIHDSRRGDPVESLRWLLAWPHTAILERVDYHFMDSNCLVITLRQAPVAYEDWNITEPENRLPQLNKIGA